MVQEAKEKYDRPAMPEILNLLSGARTLIHDNMIGFRKVIYWFLLISCLVGSCRLADPDAKEQPPGFDDIRTGMSYLEVAEAAGIPDRKVNVGTVTDEYGLETKTEEWYYGDNCLVVIVNDTVQAIDTDLQGTYNKIQRIIDSARAAGDTSVMIQPLQGLQ